MKDAPISRVQKIVIAEDGPYIVSGSVPLAVQVITPNEEGLSWDWVKGKSFPSAATYKLCRCGRSKTKPFCDGTHAAIGFDGEETASRVPVARQSETYDGPTMTLSDAEELCAFARFCDPGGKIWSLIEATDDPGVVSSSSAKRCTARQGGWSCMTRRPTRTWKSRCLPRSAWSRIRRWGAAAPSGSGEALRSSRRTARGMKPAIG